MRRIIYVTFLLVLPSLARTLLSPFATAWIEREEDSLLPYHGRRMKNVKTKSHRFIRSCIEESHGSSSPFELHPISRQPNLQSFRFQREFYVHHRQQQQQQQRQYRRRTSPWSSLAKTVQGHVAVLGNGLETLSVVEPGGEGGGGGGGCAAHLRRRVEETATAADCVIASNAGFFDTHTRACHGHVVTNGRRIQTGSEHQQNAHFGITKDGQIFIGYLDVDTPLLFEQLVGGVVWLVRRGKSFVKESGQFECEDTQETGSLRRFIEVISGRTAIGHNEKGEIILVQVDGRTDKKGLNLHEFSELLISFGVVNAINLDGGGSATFVQNKITVNFPSDICTPKSLLDSNHSSLSGETSSSISWSCDRPVSTIICLHEERCPQNCSDHGECRGTGVKKKCDCMAGWQGKDCKTKCSAGKYGANCTFPCNCPENNSHQSCDRIDGNCQCFSGYVGRHCERQCPYGYFGSNCSSPCECGDDCPCHHVTGACVWKPALKHSNSSRSQIDFKFLSNSSSFSPFYLDLDRSSNCKIRLYVDSVSRDSDEGSEIELLRKILLFVIVIAILSIMVNISLLCWNRKTSTSKYGYEKLAMDLTDDSSQSGGANLNLKHETCPDFLHKSRREFPQKAVKFKRGNDDSSHTDGI